MPLPVAAIGRTYSLTASGTPQLVPIPTGDIEWATLLITGASAFSVAFNTTDPAFPFAAGTVAEIPVQRTGGGSVYITGSGTVNIMALGFGAKSGWTA